MLMEEIKKEILNINTKVDRMYFAMMGSDITKDGGLVTRVVKAENRIEILEAEVEALKTKNAKIEVYQKIMWSALGGTVGMIFAYVINLVIK